MIEEFPEFLRTVSSDEFRAEFDPNVWLFVEKICKLYKTEWIEAHNWGQNENQFVLEFKAKEVADISNEEKCLSFFFRCYDW